MTPFLVPATGKTPLVELWPDKGELLIRGSSISENSDHLFRPLFDKLREYAGAPPARTRVVIDLAYFNSTTAKWLLDMFKLLEDVHAHGLTKVEVTWYHATDDLDMEEAGSDFKALLDIPVSVVAN